VWLQKKVGDNMKKMTAFLAGLIVSPLLPAIISSAMTSRMRGGNIDVTSMLGWVLVAYIFSLFAELLFGLPIIVVLWRLNLIRWWSAVLGGMFSAICISVLMRLPNQLTVQNVFVPGNILMGSVSAFCFWLFWRLGSEEEVSK
jgi:hypothetical protein